MKRQLDIFPAVIKVIPPDSLSALSDVTADGPNPPSTRRLDRCRVVVMNDTVLVAVDSPTGAQLVFREKVEEMIKEKHFSRIRTETGKMLSVQKDSNCGCGSRLRSWNPYGTGGIASSRDPE